MTSQTRTEHSISTWTTVVQWSRVYIENNTWVLAWNTRFISRVEHDISLVRTIHSDVASPTIQSRYANSKSLSLFISSEMDCFHSQWTQKYLHSGTKLSGWLSYWLYTGCIKKTGVLTWSVNFKANMKVRRLYLHSFEIAIFRLFYVLYFIKFGVIAGELCQFK
jgi:hypothetical protein